MGHNSEHTRCYIKKDFYTRSIKVQFSVAKRHTCRIVEWEQGVKEQFQAFKYISIIMFNNEADDAKENLRFLNVVFHNGVHHKNRLSLMMIRTLKIMKCFQWKVNFFIISYIINIINIVIC